MAINFNSINPDVYNVNSAEFNGVERERANIVAMGRLLMAERNGRDLNSLRTLENKSTEYTLRLSDTGGKSYADMNQKMQRTLMLFCAKRACSATGAVAPATYQDFLKAQRRFMSDRTFLNTLQGIIREVVTPIIPTTMSNAVSWFAETVSVPLGQTYELDVASNDFFVFEDDSWGASRSKPSNYLYNQPITINPTLRTAKSTIKWYQLVGNNADLGRVFNAIAAGMYSKIVALWNKAMTKVGDTGSTYVPSGLRFTNTSKNWVKAAERVSMVNGTQYSNIVAIGMPSALSTALPSGIVNGSSTNLDTALSTMLGLDYTRYGFMGEYMGVRLHPLQGAIVPGTQNSTVTNIVPDNKIWMMATAGYKPVYIGLEEGGDITIQLDPSETADMTIDIMVSMSIEAVPVCASKIAIITV